MNTIGALGILLLALAPSAFAGPAPAAATRLTAAVKTAMHAPADGFHDAYLRSVWLQSMSDRLAKYITQTDARNKFLITLHAEAARASVPPQLVLAIVNVESDFDPWAVSATGAQGLMQIMPFWLKEAGKPGDNLFDPRTNLRLGCTILAYYLKRSHGDIALALQSYYGKRYGNVYSGRVLKLLATRWYWKN
ncbi:MAG: transglycosylase SLT domain-containing protein [Gammaproteobacteria bacterium]